MLKAGLAHLWFVTIHPFDDGNGRIARAIEDLAFARSSRAAAASTACPPRSSAIARTTTPSSNTLSEAISTSPAGCSGSSTHCVDRSATPMPPSTRHSRKRTSGGPGTRQR
ncbi:Fic family protein [Nocardia jiangsuensis]|uniref:Fic family protein n=1 Tax=Nocardia jiangsuensis TaxID=1691563 RepID=A0ABV8E0M3_9NOCA